MDLAASHPCNNKGTWLCLPPQVPEEQLPPGLQRTALPMPIHGQQLYAVRLSEFSSLAWATLKADLLFVLWELMGGKTRAQTQQLLVGEKFVEVLGTMFDGLSWTTPRDEDGNPEVVNLEGVCGPQSCLQVCPGTRGRYAPWGPALQSPHAQF